MYMSEKISWNFVAQALNGPSISGAGNLNVEDYEKINFSLAKKGVSGATHSVNLSGISTVSLLIISTSTPDSKITYKVTPAIKDAPADGYVLDGPHIFIGAGAIAFLVAATGLTFTNATGADAEIQILVGRTTA